MRFGVGVGAGAVVGTLTGAAAGCAVAAVAAIESVRMRAASSLIMARTGSRIAVPTFHSPN